MKNLKVIHLTEAFGWSGGNAQALFLAKGLRERGHTSVFLCPADGDLGKLATADKFELRHFRPDSSVDISAARQVADQFEELKPDVVQAHHPKAHGIALLAKIFSRHKPVLLYTRRVSYPIPDNFITRYKFTCGLIDGGIAVTESVRRHLISRGVKPEKVRTIYSGSDPSVYSPRPPDAGILAELAIPEGAPIIMIVANYKADKGHHILFAAASRLQAKGIKFHLVCVGRDTDSKELRDKFAASGLPEDRGRFLGQRTDVDRLLSVASVSVNAAINGEALSGSIRESLAMGVPVVASDIAGNAEIVSDGENGYTFPMGDASGMADRLEKVLSDPSIRGRFSSKAVALVKERFTTDIMTERTLQYYNDLLQARAR